MSKVIIPRPFPGPSHPPPRSAAPPIPRAQTAAERIGAAHAGAAIIHLHARKPDDGEPTGNPDVFAQFLPKIHTETDAVINLTTGGSPTMSVPDPPGRAPPLQPEVCPLHPDSLHFALLSPT